MGIISHILGGGAALLKATLGPGRGTGRAPADALLMGRSLGGLQGAPENEGTRGWEGGGGVH